MHRGGESIISYAGEMHDLNLGKRNPSAGAGHPPKRLALFTDVKGIKDNGKWRNWHKVKRN